MFQQRFAATGSPSGGLRRQLLRHRRALAAVAAGVAVLAFARAISPPPLETVDVVAAAADLPAGHVLKDEDLSARAWPRAFPVPDAFTSRAQAIGRLTAGAIGAGEPISSTRIIAPGMLAGEADSSLVAISVRLADSGEAKLLRPGDHLDLLAARGVGPGDTTGAAATPAETVAANVRLLAVPGQDDHGSEGLLGSGSGSGAGLGEGAMIVIAVDPVAARRIAAAAATSRLSTVLRPVLATPSPTPPAPATPSATDGATPTPTPAQTDATSAAN